MKCSHGPASSSPDSPSSLPASLPSDDSSELSISALATLAWDAGALGAPAGTDVPADCAGVLAADGAAGVAVGAAAGVGAALAGEDG